ncbi:MAG: hypothetical protein MI741_09490 [Rhodospirillales bacterium]|nr:hypothetical protein [Rhodospirillales bacterium]
MSEHSYPLEAVLGDYLRAAAGIAISIVPVAMVESANWVTYLFAALICLFVFYGGRTLMRHRTTILVSEDGIATNLPLRQGIAWKELSGIRLRFFATKRDRTKGWMQLTLKGPGCRISVDSTITGFRGIVTRATAAAGDNGISLDEKSVINMASLEGKFEEGEP